MTASYPLKGRTYGFAGWEVPMSQQKEAEGARQVPNDIDEIVQIIAKIAKFRGVTFEADERKVKLYRSGSQNLKSPQDMEGQNDDRLRYG